VCGELLIFSELTSRHRQLPNKFADDDLDQDCLRVVESLKRPAVEPQARDFLVIAHAGFDLLEDTGLPCAPVTVDTVPADAAVALWQRVQEVLNGKAAHLRGRSINKTTGLLMGRRFDESGEPLYSCWAKKGALRYRYFVSRKLM
jgi:hypothetical protein